MIACSMARLPPARIGPVDPGAFASAERRPDVDRACCSGGRTPRSAGAGSWRRTRPSRASPRRRSAVALAGRRHDPRVGGEHAVDVGVDLAESAPSAAASATAVVSEPPRPSVVMSLVSWETPWKPATIAIAPSSSALWIRPGVMSMIRALPCARVGDHARLRAGERPRLVAQVGDRHREQRHRDPLAGGEQHVQLTRRRQRADLLARSISSSVVSPIADTTTTTSLPALLVATIRWATRLIPSASATDEPPYFCTTMPTGRRSSAGRLASRRSARIYPGHAPLRRTGAESYTARAARRVSI